MKIIVSTKGMDSTEALKSAVKKSVESVEHYFPEDDHITLEAILEHEGHHIFNCHLEFASKHIHDVNIKESSHDMYKAITQAGHRLKQKISKERERNKDKRSS